MRIALVWGTPNSKMKSKSTDASSSTRATTPTAPSSPAKKSAKKPAAKKRTAKRTSQKASASRQNKGSTERESAAMTFADLTERWLAHLAEDGKSSSTIATYRRELAHAATAIGTDTKLDAITPAAVVAYFASDAVTKTLAGLPRATPTILLSRRVLRIALAWAEAQELVAEAPLPDPTGETQS